MDNGGSDQDFFASLMNFFNQVNEVIWADWVLYAVLAVLPLDATTGIRFPYQL